MPSGSRAAACAGTTLHRAAACDGQGTCPPSAQVSCDDGIACTFDACNAGSETCSHTADDSLCPGDQVCDPSAGCRCPDEAPDASGEACIAEGASCNTGLLGVCAAGTLQCVGNQPTCVQDVQPSAEVCDGLDNDCDGEVDEGFNLGTPCDGNDPNPDPEGVWACDQSGRRVCTDTTG